MYGLWFKKPVDIHDPTVLSQEEIARVKNTGRLSKLPNRAPNLGDFPDVSEGWQVLGVLGMLVLLCAAHGGVHLYTWNFDFPTPIEQKLWRIACISIVAGSLLAPRFCYWSIVVFEELRGFYRRDNRPLVSETFLRESTRQSPGHNIFLMFRLASVLEC
jgi:hypothetical protein